MFTRSSRTLTQFPKTDGGAILDPPALITVPASTVSEEILFVNKISKMKYTGQQTY
jgi:hypothetical protein